MASPRPADARVASIDLIRGAVMVRAPAVALLHPACRAFADLKSRRPAAWLRSR